MGRKERQRTIMGIGMLDLPEELRSTLVDMPREFPSEGEDESVYRAWLGRTIDDKYRLESLIAEGGMGAVFEATPLPRGMPVAFKVMHPELGGDGAIVQRFAREVEIGEKLTHDNVVAVLDTGTVDGAPYLVLELVLGPTLSHAMWEDGAFEWRRASKIGAQIAGAIGAAWDGGFVHRDLKPDNVVLEPDGRGGEKVKLLDFGIAHDRSDAGVKAKLTVAGEVLGTLGYMAPEQAVGQGVDVRSDLYALGVLLWEMLAGYALFGEEVGRRDYLLAQMRLDPTPTTDLCPGSPPELDALVRELLTHLQSERPDDPWAVQAKLRALTAADEASRPSVSDPGGVAAPESSRLEPQTVAAKPVAGQPEGPPREASEPPSPVPEEPVTPPRSGAARSPAPVGLPQPAPSAPRSSRTLMLVGGVLLALAGGGMCVVAAAVLLLR